MTRSRWVRVGTIAAAALATLIPLADAGAGSIGQNGGYSAAPPANNGIRPIAGIYQRGSGRLARGPGYGVPRDLYRRGFGRGYGTGNAYFPNGGYFGGYPGPLAYPGYAGYGAGVPSGYRSEAIYQRSEVIVRGPAFGEPGYYARASIYRLTPAPTSKRGMRRFWVERHDF